MLQNSSAVTKMLMWHKIRGACPTSPGLTTVVTKTRNGTEQRRNIPFRSVGYKIQTRPDHQTTTPPERTHRACARRAVGACATRTKLVRMERARPLARNVKSDLSVSEVFKYFGNLIQPAIKPKASGYLGRMTVVKVSTELATNTIFPRACSRFLKVLSISQGVLCFLQKVFACVLSCTLRLLSSVCSSTLIFYINTC